MQECEECGEVGPNEGWRYCPECMKELQEEFDRVNPPEDTEPSPRINCKLGKKADEGSNWFDNAVRAIEG